MESLSQAERDVLAERRRQIDVEGWTPKHDDAHKPDELAQAAVCYAMPPALRELQSDDTPVLWPWHPRWWKKGGRRRNLVKAAALIIAEIERLDRVYIEKKEPPCSA